jgi:hypothetical protein
MKKLLTMTLFFCIQILSSNENTKTCLTYEKINTQSNKFSISCLETSGSSIGKWCMKMAETNSEIKKYMSSDKTCASVGFIKPPVKLNIGHVFSCDNSDKSSNPCSTESLKKISALFKVTHE